jgi:16S rRNA (uracil1498-N3)-methyltransferase
MITPRLFMEGVPTAGAAFRLPEAAAHHAIRVLRLRVGDVLALFTGGGGEFRARIDAISRDDVSVTIESFDSVEREAPLSITLMQGIAHGERMDTIVQKATELGVARIVPVACERSVTRLDADRAEKRVAHWRKIAISACEQCGRNRLPEIADPVALEVAVTLAVAGMALMLSPRASQSLRSVAESSVSAVTLLVGPEGGFTDVEENAAIAAGFQPMRLGPRVLRTETAGPAFIAALLALHGDL